MAKKSNMKTTTKYSRTVPLWVKWGSWPFKVYIAILILILSPLFILFDVVVRGKKLRERIKFAVNLVGDMVHPPWKGPRWQGYPLMTGDAKGDFMRTVMRTGGYDSPDDLYEISPEDLEKLLGVDPALSHMDGVRQMMEAQQKETTGAMLAFGVTGKTMMNMTDAQKEVIAKRNAAVKAMWNKKIKLH